MAVPKGPVRITAQFPDGSTATFNGRCVVTEPPPAHKWLHEVTGGGRYCSAWVNRRCRKAYRLGRIGPYNHHYSASYRRYLKRIGREPGVSDTAPPTATITILPQGDTDHL